MSRQTRVSEDKERENGRDWIVRPVSFGAECKNTPITLVQAMEWVRLQRSFSQPIISTLRDFEATLVRGGIDLGKDKVIIEVLKDLTGIFEHKDKYGMIVRTDHPSPYGVLMLCDNSTESIRGFFSPPVALRDHPMCNSNETLRIMDDYMNSVFRPFGSFSDWKAHLPFMNDEELVGYVRISFMFEERKQYRMLRSFVKKTGNRFAHYVFEHGDLPTNVFFDGNDNTVKDRMISQALVTMGRIIVRKPEALRKEFVNGKSKFEMALLFFRAAIYLSTKYYDYVVSVRFDIFWNCTWECLILYMRDVIFPFLEFTAQHPNHGQELAIELLNRERRLFNGHCDPLVFSYGNLTCVVCGKPCDPRCVCARCPKSDMYGPNKLVSNSMHVWCSVRCKAREGHRH